MYCLKQMTVLTFMQITTSTEYSEGIGHIRLGNAINEATKRAHINFHPTGTIDIHSEYEAVSIENEVLGARTLVTGSTMTYTDAFGTIACESEYLPKHAGSRIYRDGSIRHVANNNTPNGSSELMLNSDGEAYLWNLLQNTYIEFPAAGDCNVVADTITLDGDVVITGSITHGTDLSCQDSESGSAKLAGQSGGQTLCGGTAASDPLVLDSTANGTKGTVTIQPTTGSVCVGTVTAPAAKLCVNGGCNIGGNTDPGDNNLSVVGSCSAASLASTVATGTAPISVVSTTKVDNLNASLLEGNAASAFATSANGPTSDQKAALAGTSGTSPSSTNKYVDNADTRLTNARTPSAHKASHITGSDILDVATTSVPGLESAADKTKLDGIASGANVTATTLAPAIHAATQKSPIVDGDELCIADSASSNVLKEITALILKTYIALGVSGGRTFVGGTGASENLTLQSTSHGTKGSIIIGTSAYDEVNNRLGIGTQVPAVPLHVVGLSQFDDEIALPTAANAGSSGFHKGTGDGASLSTYNILLKGWWGLGLADYTGTVRSYYDFRAGSLYLGGNCSALSFTDRTPAFTGQALDALRKIVATKEGEIDHSTLPEFARHIRKSKDDKGKNVEVTERNIGNMVSVLTKGTQELITNMESAIKDRDTKIDSLIKRIEILESKIKQVR